MDNFFSDGAKLANFSKKVQYGDMNVLVIHTGGMPSPAELSKQAIEQQLKSYLELQLVAEVDVVVLSNVAGADVMFDLATKIGTHIQKQYDNYDGFVIIHSLDNAICTANLLAFQLTNLGKPIIFTGTTIPEQFFNFPGNFSADEQISYREMSLRTSLVTSVQLATQNCAGVMLAFGPHIIQAVRAVETVTPEQTGFVAWPDGEIAMVRFGIELGQRILKRHDDSPAFDARYSTDVVVLPRHPELYLTPIPPTTRAVLLPTFQEQFIPNQLKLPDTALAVTVSSLFDQITVPSQVLRLPPITPIAVHMKLLVALGRYHTASEVKEYLHTNTIGEFGHL